MLRYVIMEVRALLFLALHLQVLFTIGILRPQKSKGMETVMLAFDAKVKKPSHAGIWYALERLLKQGDTLIILSVHHKVMKKVDLLSHFPGLSNKCTQMGVKLVVLSKINKALEVTIHREAMNQHASHVILDSSLNSKPRLTSYKQNISCNLTRIRRFGGLDLIRPEKSSSALWVAPRLLSNDELIDEFEFSLGVPAAESSSERSLRIIEHPTFESDHARLDSSVAYDSDDLFSINIDSPSDRQTEIDVDSFAVTRSSLSSSCDDEVVHFTRAQVPQREFFAQMIALVASRREDRRSIH